MTLLAATDRVGAATIRRAGACEADDVVESSIRLARAGDAWYVAGEQPGEPFGVAGA